LPARNRAIEQRARLALVGEDEARAVLVSDQLDRLGARLVPVRGRAGISALLDSVPLAVSFAEVRRESVEDLNEEPLELEPLEGDEGL
jgi:hypothetical protein